MKRVDYGDGGIGINLSEDQFHAMLKLIARGDYDVVFKLKG